MYVNATSCELETPPAAKHMIAMTDDPTDIEKHFLYVDSNPPDTASAPQTTRSARQVTCIGGGIVKPGIIDISSAGNLFTGDIYEVIIYATPVSKDEISCIYKYLVNKWGQ
jgi:hypothetical protein